MGWLFPDTPDEDVKAYQDARDDHDQSECGGTWRSHFAPQERLDCIKPTTLTAARGGGADMGWLFGDRDAVEAHKAARAEFHEYCDHQRERGDDYESPEYLRLGDRIADTEQHVPWWRR